MIRTHFYRGFVNKEIPRTFGGNSVLTGSNKLSNIIEKVCVKQAVDSSIRGRLTPLGLRNQVPVIYWKIFDDFLVFFIEPKMGSNSQQVGGTRT